jgi:Enoyl-CoA hydratase/isomerase
MLSLQWRQDIRVVVLAGAGRAFCSGFDLKLDMKSTNERGVTEVLAGQRRISQIVVAMRRCPQPIIALVDGPASGGGFALALASDIRIATPRTKMNAAFIRIGLSACDIGVSYFLPRMVGSAVAAEYLLTGRFMDAETVAWRLWSPWRIAIRPCVRRTQISPRASARSWRSAARSIAAASIPVRRLIRLARRVISRASDVLGIR